MFLNRATITIPSDVNEKYKDQYLNDQMGNLCAGKQGGYSNYHRLVKVEHVSSHEVVIYYESTHRFQVPTGMELRIAKAKDAKVDSTEGPEKVLASGSKRSKGVGNRKLSTQVV